MNWEVKISCSRRNTQSYILMGFSRCNDSSRLSAGGLYSSRCKREKVEMIALGSQQEGYTPSGVKEGLLKSEL